MVYIEAINPYFVLMTYPVSCFPHSQLLSHTFLLSDDRGNLPLRFTSSSHLIALDF